jgi:hypothetical protein
MINIRKQLLIVLVFVALTLVVLADEGDKSDESNKPLTKIKAKVMPVKPMINSEDEVSDSDSGYIYQGIWQDSLNSFAIMPLRLSGFNRECVVTSSSNHLEVIQFVGDSWRNIAHIPFTHIYHDYHNSLRWTTGDLDGDGSDEIITCYDSFVNQYSWNGKEFQGKTAEFRYLVEQVRIGDINNDGDNELVFFCGESLPHERIGYPYHLCIAKWKDSRLNILWDDSAKLDYAVRNMPDFLILIADVVNTGYNQLLLSRSQSDVSPTAYNLLKWNDKKGRLELNKSFKISNQILPADTHHNIMPYLTSKLNSITQNDTTFLSGIFVSSGKQHIEFCYWLFKIKGDSLIQTRPIFHDYPGGTCFINLDGKGVGVLVIWREPPSTTNMFRFYRL